MASPAQCIAVVIAVTAIGIAQTPDATMSGIVVDDASRPVRDATVLIKPLDGGSERSVSTDGSGQYRAEHLPRGEYQVVGLHGGAWEHVFERVHVQGSLTLPPIVLSGDWVCECGLNVLDETRGLIQLSHHDARGNRLLRSWVTVEPGQSGPYALGPRTACLCGDSPSLLGRLDVLRGGSAPGRYVVRGAAAGYSPWTISDVVVIPNHVTKIEATWTLADTRESEASARAQLRRGEALARIETFAGIDLIAVADDSDGHALLAAIDAHRFDNLTLERQQAGWQIMPPPDRTLVGLPRRTPEDDLMESVLNRRAPFARVISGDAVPLVWLRRAMPMMAVTRVW